MDFRPRLAKRVLALRPHPHRTLQPRSVADRAGRCHRPRCLAGRGLAARLGSRALRSGPHPPSRREQGNARAPARHPPGLGGPPASRRRRPELLHLARRTAPARLRRCRRRPRRIFAARSLAGRRSRRLLSKFRHPRPLRRRPTRPLPPSQCHHHRRPLRRRGHVRERDRDDPFLPRQRPAMD